MKELGLTESDYDVIVDSPGRINITGEHTDYNNGFVLSTAINKKTQFKLRKNGTSGTCNVYSQNLDTSFSFDLEKVEKSQQQWENYILGVIYEMQLTNKLEGFDCVLNSDIPVGSGISSSAALECGLAFGLNELFNLNLSKLTLVELSQRAEHNFVGTKCGIMDQFSSVMSKRDHVILLDYQSLESEYVPIKIEPYKILLLNTNVSHNLASEEYNLRRSQCEKGVEIIKQKYPEINSLRDVSMSVLNELMPFIPSVIYNRCTYVIQEINRVLDSVKSFRINDLNTIGKLMFETHEGLRHLYEVSCHELDFLVDFSKKYNEVIGARMMGGDFGGCTINLIYADAIKGFIEDVSEAYFNKFNLRLTAFEAMPSEGTTIKTAINII